MSQSNAELRVLVADPSGHMVDLIVLMLHSLRIRSIDEATDLARAATLIGRHPYDLLLVDERFSTEGDFDLIRTLRQSVDHPNRQTPIFMMSAMPDVKMIAAARDAGVTEFLRKPFSAQHIQLRLDAIRAAPREFVAAKSYAGPDRRRREVGGVGRRRASDPGKQSA